MLENGGRGGDGARVSGDSGKFRRHQGSPSDRSSLERSLPTLLRYSDGKLFQESREGAGVEGRRETTMGRAVFRNGFQEWGSRGGSGPEAPGKPRGGGGIPGGEIGQRL